MAVVKIRKISERERAAITKAQAIILSNIPKQEIVEKLATLSTAAFGLVAALAWNDMIKSLFDQYFKDKSNLWAQFAYAVLVTILAVLVAFYIGRAAAKLKNEDAKKQLEIQIAEQVAKQELK